MDIFIASHGVLRSVNLIASSSVSFSWKLIVIVNIGTLLVLNLLSIWYLRGYIQVAQIFNSPFILLKKKHTKQGNLTHCHTSILGHIHTSNNKVNAPTPPPFIFKHIQIIRALIKVTCPGRTSWHKPSGQNMVKCHWIV